MSVDLAISAHVLWVWLPADTVELRGSKKTFPWISVPTIAHKAEYRAETGRFRIAAQCSGLLMRPRKARRAVHPCRLGGSLGVSRGF